MSEIELLFENGITHDGLKTIFNPYRIMKNLYETSDDCFSPDVLSALERNIPYSEIRLLPFFALYLDNEKEELFEKAVETFLSYSDGMPFYPTTEDWVKKISAPEDFIKKIFPIDCICLTSILGYDFFCYELEIIFSKKIKSMEELEEDNRDYGRFEFTEYYFSDYLSNRQPETIKKQWEKYLSKEFEVARRFQSAWENKEHFYAISKEKKLSVNETVMLFVDYAFDGYDELVS